MSEFKPGHPDFDAEANSEKHWGSLGEQGQRPEAPPVRHKAEAESKSTPMNSEDREETLDEAERRSEEAFVKRLNQPDREKIDRMERRERGEGLDEPLETEEVGSFAQAMSPRLEVEIANARQEHPDDRQTQNNLQGDVSAMVYLRRAVESRSEEDPAEQLTGMMRQYENGRSLDGAGNVQSVGYDGSTYYYAARALTIWRGLQADAAAVRRDVLADPEHVTIPGFVTEPMNVIDLPQPEAEGRRAA